MEALIVAGANVHSAAMDDMSSLHFAAQQGHLDVCRALLNTGKRLFYMLGNVTHLLCACQK